MTTNISFKLDTNAMRSLINSDPEFKMELQRAVIANICKEMFTNHLSQEIVKLAKEACEAELADVTEAIYQNNSIEPFIRKTLENMLKHERTTSYQTKTVLSTQIRDLIRRGHERLCASLQHLCY